MTQNSEEHELGIPPGELQEDELRRELEQVHRTRHDTFRHGSDSALDTHNRRMAELEGEYLRRFPEREVDPERLREGARREGARPDPELLNNSPLQRP
jgi:hypothetical protein